MMVKPISITISTRPPIRAGETRSLVSVPVTVKRGADDPDQQQKPGRDQHHRAIVAMRREIEDQDEADAGDGRERNARDARRDRRVIDGKPDEGDEENQPDGGDMRGAHMPAAEIEIGE